MPQYRLSGVVWVNVKVVDANSPEEAEAKAELLLSQLTNRPDLNVKFDGASLEVWEMPE